MKFLRRPLVPVVRKLRRLYVVQRLARSMPAPLHSRVAAVSGWVRGEDTTGGRFPGQVRPLGVNAYVHRRTAGQFTTAGVEPVRARNAELIITGATTPSSSRPSVTVVRIGDQLPPVPDRLTPFGFDLAKRNAFLSFRLSPAIKRHGLVEQQSRRHGWSVRQWEAPRAADLVRSSEGFRRRAQQHVAVLDELGVYGTEEQRAHLLVCSAAAGTPVVIRDATGLDAHLPAAVIDTMTGLDERCLVDKPARDAVAFRQWAAVLDSFQMRARWGSVLAGAGVDHPVTRPRSVSVIVATNRADMTDNWPLQLAAQTHPDLEVIAALHGDAFSEHHEAQLREVLGDRLTVVRRGGDAMLGDLLNAATDAASGELVIKWDDDDLYSRGHIADLVRSYEYSGATLVGKACEYVYLCGPNITVQRAQGPRETFSTTMAGGTLCVSRESLDQVGGWTVAPRRVDSLLIEKILAAGGDTYRSMGFGYVMTRAADRSRHTWTVGDEIFLKPGNPQRRGLALDWAMVDPPTEVVSRWTR